MNWKEYSQLALRTEAIPSIQYMNMPGQAEGNKATRLLHAAMGLVTETDELEDHIDRVNLIEEIGDCFWYLPIIESIVPGVDFATLVYTRVSMGSSEDSLRACRRYAAYLVDVVGKRHIIYGKELNTDKLIEAATSYVYYLVRYCASVNISLEDCWEANIKKLEKRYPDLRFNGEHASIRNVANELSHIESAVEMEAKDVAYDEDAVVSMDDQIKFRWGALKNGIGVDLVYNSPPAEVARKVLEHLNCTEDYAKALLGEEFTRCRFTIVHEGDLQILTAVPFDTCNTVHGEDGPIDAKAFNSTLRNNFTAIQIKDLAVKLSHELAEQYNSQDMIVLSNAMYEVYRSYARMANVLVDDSIYGIYTALGYATTVEALLCIMHTTVGQRNASDNAGSGQDAR